MYKRFYRLKSDPFRSSPDPSFLYMMPQTREALAGLQYGISARKGFIVLTGEVGTGKTTLLHEVLAGFDPEKTLSAFLFNPRLDVLDFLEFLLSDFGLVPTNRTKSGMLLQLNRWLIDQYKAGRTCIVVIDEAHHLSWELLEEIRLLTNLETSSDKLLQIVLSAQPELEDMLRQPNARQIRQRIALWCRTLPLEPEQAAPYIEARLRSAGLPAAAQSASHSGMQSGEGQSIFPPQVVELIYQASYGTPRLMNLICEHCLLRGYADNANPITPAIVSAVLEDLELQMGAPPMKKATGNPEEREWQR